jgi:hypothetical protein
MEYFRALCKRWLERRPANSTLTNVAVLGLIVDVLLFFAKPLFNERYSFPWDFRNMQLPVISFLADQLRQGELALWDPYTYCGNPIYANISACFFHPLVFTAAALSNVIGLDHLGILLEWVVVTQICIGGIAMYLCLRELGASQAGAWLTGVMFQTGPYFASRIEHIGAIMAAAWMPVAAFAILRMRSKASPHSIALAAVALAMAIFAGLPPATLAVFVFVFFFALLLVLFRVQSMSTLLATSFACILGIGIASVQFIPSVELTNNSVAKYRADWLGTGGGLKWQSLVSLVLPNHYHIFDLAKFNGPWDPTFLYLYFTIPGLVLALAALFYKDRVSKLFGVLGAFGFLFMLGDSTVVWRRIYPIVPEPIRIGVQPEYTYCIFSFCIAALAGFGLTRALSKYPRRQWLVAIWIAADLYAVGSGRPMNCASVEADPAPTRSSFSGSSLLLSEVRNHSRASFPPARIDTMDAAVDWATAAPLTQVPTGSGCNPLALERIIQLRLGMHSGGRSGWYYPVVEPSSPLLNLLAEKYLLVGDRARSSMQSPPTLRLLANLPGNGLYENASVLPRAFLVPTVIKVGQAQAVEIVHTSGIDFSKSAVVEGNPPYRLPEAPTDFNGSVHFIEYSANRLVLSTTSPSRSFLVVLEGWYPGWEAKVDGIPSPIYPTDVAFRGLFLTEGPHRIEMFFKPHILTWAAAISLLALFTTGVLFYRPSTAPR